MNTTTISSKRLLLLIIAVTFTGIFYITIHSNPFFNFIGSTNMGVIRGCYRIYAVSEREPLEMTDLVQRNCTKSLPKVVIIGAKKCGTTALKEFLTFHPQIEGTTLEPQFFGKHYYFGLQWYLDQLPYTTPNQLALDKTPKYLVHPVAPHAIHKDLDRNVKLILILRDPVKRAISDFVQIHLYHVSKDLPEPTIDTLYYKQKRRFMESVTLMEASLTEKQKQTKMWVKKLEKEYYKGISNNQKETFEESVILPNGRVNTKLAIINTGIYVKYVKKWLDFFPRNQLLVLDGEEFTYNPIEALQKVEAFVNVSNFFTPQNFYFDESKRFFCLAKPIHSCMGNSKGREHPHVPEDALETLYKFYRPYNLELKELLDLDFPWLEK